MVDLSGCLSARLADRSETYESALVDEINRRVHPPRAVTEGDVYIRAMYIASDQINSQGGRFAPEELDRLAQLMVDSPVLVGHQRDSLPLARNFSSGQADIDGCKWIKSYFYWMRESDGAEDLKNNIDGGIYKECSVSFLFGRPECSICGQDIRHCRHVPFQEYEVRPGRNDIAHFIYRDIQKVLETSLVFRGAIPNTRITDALSPRDGDPKQIQRYPVFTKLSDAGSRDHDRGYARATLAFTRADRFRPGEEACRFYVAPYQPGMMIRIIKENREVELEAGCLLPEAVRIHLAETVSQLAARSLAADAVLYAVRGKERLDGLGLAHLIESGTNRHRLRLRLCDLGEIDGQVCRDESFALRQQRLARLLCDRAHRGLETINFRGYDGDARDSVDFGSESRQYNFGLEVVTENRDGRLARHIISDDARMPATIETITDHNRAHITCDLKPYGGETVIKGLVCPRAAGMERGAVVVLGEKSRGRGTRKPAWMLVDLVPGGQSLRIAGHGTAMSPPVFRLYVTGQGDQLRLYYRHEDGWQSVAVHHFSTALLLRGRRFIADVNTCEKSDAHLEGKRSVPLRSLARVGKLVHLQIAGTVPPFGDAAGLWLRPVLIDGEERYLFYADRANRLQAGL